MISCYVRESKGYTQNDLCVILGETEERIVSLIRKLREYGVIKVIKKSRYDRDLSELADEDTDLEEIEMGDAKHKYAFKYVGIIDVFGKIIKCYPKYLVTEKKPISQLKQIIKVIGKYNSNEGTVIKMYSETDESKSVNILAIYLFLLFDYYENGIYNETEDIVEDNGLGEIVWDKTINETFAFLSKGSPYYLELKTKRRKNNEFDYFKRLHEYVLTKASEELKEADLLDLFEINDVELSDEMIEDFGEKEYILNKIEMEINVQFNSRKQLVLKSIYAYLNHSGSLFDTDCIAFYGTSSFYDVWEKVCQCVFDNKLQVGIRDMVLPTPCHKDYNGNPLLIDLIEKPYWTVSSEKAKDTFKPDLVTIKGSKFIIIDAKYYVPIFKNGVPPLKQPGIESISKQYMYQLCFKEFIEKQDFTTVKNCFLMPTEKDKVENKGEVKMDMFSRLGLENIKVRFLPADYAYEKYLMNETIDVDKIEL